MSAVSSARSVCEMYGPWSRSLVNSVWILPTLASRSCASSVSVISSLALAMISPVSVLTTLCASVRPRMNSSGAAMRLMPAASMSRMCLTVMRLSLATIVLPGLVVDVEARHFAAQALGHHLELDAVRASMWKVSKSKNSVEDPLGRVAERLQQDRHRHLAAAVDAEEHDVLRVELEVEPRAAVGNHARREQQLAARNASCRGRARRTRRASGAAATTMTRSVPLMMNEPVVVMSGISPM